MSPTKPADWNPASVVVCDNQIASYDDMRKYCPVTASHLSIPLIRGRLLRRMS